MSNNGQMKIKLKSLQSPFALLCLGIVTRCIVYLFLSPYNNDAHITIVEYLVKHKTFPDIADNYLAFHPPLYYWIAASILALFKSDKVVQLFSLATSIGTLIVIYKLIYKVDLIASPRARLYSFLLTCFLPQFIMFGLYISNDSLSILLGCLTVLEVVAYIKNPDWKQTVILGAVTGLGLLTKTTFVAFLPVLLLFVLFLQLREHHSLLKAVRAVAVLFAISCALGSYKYIDNYARYKRPFINSLDVPVWSFQTRSYRGFGSYCDFDILRLLASPSISYEEVMGSATPNLSGSYPLLLYGTFWYQLIPESNFRGTVYKPFSYLGSVIYLIALVPTACFVLGLLRLLLRLLLFVKGFDRRRPDDRRMMGVYVAAALLAANTIVIIAAVAHYHVWTLMQGRYLFPSMVGTLVIFSAGVEIWERAKVGSVVLKSSMIVLMALFGLYFLSEVGYLALYMIDPGIKALIKGAV